MQRELKLRVRSKDSRNTQSRETSQERPRTQRPSTSANRTIDILPSIKSRKSNYNKYYIQPEFRFRQKQANPKANPESGSESYIYNNLHNWEFWNWVHPLEQYQIRPPSQTTAHNPHIEQLHKFERVMEQVKKKRVPSIVSELTRRQSS